MNLRYSPTIRWSERDRADLALFPELHGDKRYATHGATYEEALKRGLEAVETLVEHLKAEGRPLPEPATAVY